MKRYRLLQDYKKPYITFGKGMINDAISWFAVFGTGSVPNNPTVNERVIAENFCNKYPDWFAAEPTKHPTKEEIIEESSHCVEVKSGRLFATQQVKSCMEKHEQSIIGQLIEKIKSQVEFNSAYKCEAIQYQGLLEILRNFKTE